MKGLLAGVLALLAAFASARTGTATVDEQAPTFTLPDVHGKQLSLADYKGKFVVLEWVNFGCPFVRKHYDSGNMQGLQKDYTGKGVVWLSICSSARGQQGYFEGKSLEEKVESENYHGTAYLTDPEGKVGRMYQARTTPHMFVINPEGVLLYAGGIDNIASTNKDDLTRATNYVREVLDAVLDGKPAPVKQSRPYGCSVKYASN
jgi:hypothetical protein